MRVFIAADHAGYELKEKLKVALTADGHELQDCGAYTLDTADNYPDFILPCAEKVAAHEGSFGIVIGASGQAEAMAANRVKGVRAAVYYGEPGKTQIDAGGKELSLIASARDHNDANILSLGARFLSEAGALAAARTFLSTPFSGDERHARRIAQF